MSEENKTLDVAIYASAIRTWLWQRIYNSLKDTNDCNFKIFFCGHMKPDFELPENFVYIHSEMGAAACVEIATRNAINSGAKYVMCLTDDFVDTTDRSGESPPKGILDTLIEEIESSEDELVVCAAFRNAMPPTPYLDMHIITGDETSPLVPVYPMMKSETLKKAGSNDKRFQALYWDCDRLFRLHELGNVKFKVCYKVEASEDVNQPSSDICGGRRNGQTLWKKHWRHDRGLLDKLWNCSRTPGVAIKRNEPVQPYLDEDLVYTVFGQ